MYIAMPIIQIEIPQEMLWNTQEEVVIRLAPTQSMPSVLERKDDRSPTFFTFMDKVICYIRHEGRTRTTETYLSARNSFRTFLNGRDCTFEDMNCELMGTYENWLKKRGLRLNTVSFYMRILRAVYNRAVDQLEIRDNRPFRHVYTGVAKTSKRAVSAEMVRLLRQYADKATAKQRFAIDMFFFSFYARGMSFVDMAFLRKSDIVDNVIVYKRKKTGQQLKVKCEEKLQEIIGRYQNESPYVLPIITSNQESAHKQYRRCQRRINRHLKDIGRKIGLQFPLTTYVARHSWATIARNLDIPISVISESMGHTSEKTTRIYLDSISSKVIDRANQSIIEAITLPNSPKE